MSPFPTSPPAAAVLLVLLPLGAGTAATAALAALQQQLGAAVRVLAIDEASHPAVVRSFGAPALPACVLVRQGVELWRQPGLPAADAVAGLLHLAQHGVSRPQTLV
jgi:fructose-1,6-bisphosphatase/inositol monophosphatase family enzyme